MMEVEQAQARILEILRPLPVELVALDAALDRHTAVEVVAKLAVPPFDNSAFDGYAVRCADLVGASPENPVRLEIQAVTYAGNPPAPAVEAGHCVRIFTGAPMPPGSDAVAMQEDTVAAGESGVAFSEPLKPWEGVRFAGEDIRAGTTIARPGARLTPTLLGLIAATGVARLSVHRAPRIALFSTGDELVDLEVDPAPGQIPDSNGILLSALARRAGTCIAISRRVADDIDATVAALDEAAATADVIVTTGGVSVGDADLLRPALAKLGGTLDFWQLSMKPGKPFAFGRLRNACWFGLPGNPVSAFVTWHLLVRPALLRLAGASDTHPRRSNGTLAETVLNEGKRRHYMRVTLDPSGAVRATGTQASHVQSSLAAANALLSVPPETSWSAGRSVEVEWIE